MAMVKRELCGAVEGCFAYAQALSVMDRVRFGAIARLASG